MPEPIKVFVVVVVVVDDDVVVDPRDLTLKFSQNWVRNRGNIVVVAAWFYCCC